MKELHLICNRLNEAIGVRLALATVVEVVGSSYRKPGARMLISETGDSIGAISGGCLEDDVRRKAVHVIGHNEARLYTYETTDDPNSEGLKLGCNGTITVLIEPFDAAEDDLHFIVLHKVYRNTSGCIVATLFNQSNAENSRQGLIAFKNESDFIFNSKDVIDVSELQDYCEKTRLSRRSNLIRFQKEEVAYTLFIEYVPPSISLVIFGSGYDIDPLVQMTDILGWRARVYDQRATIKSGRSFPVQALQISELASIMKNIDALERTAFVIMSHNYEYDKDVLFELLQYEITYVGMLGPRSKLNRVRSDWKNEGKLISEEDLARIHSPIGLDIGGETPEEIALSITSEIMSEFSLRNTMNITSAELSQLKDSSN